LEQDFLQAGCHSCLQ